MVMSVEKTKKRKNKTSYDSQKLNDGRAARLIYLFLISGAIVMIIPLVWMFESSLKTPGQFLTTQLSLAMPSDPQWANYFRRVWQMEPALQRGILNSIIISVSTIVVGTFVSSLAAFSYSKLRFPGKAKLFFGRASHAYDSVFGNHDSAVHHLCTNRLGKHMASADCSGNVG